MAYLRARAAATPNLEPRARYLHAVAGLTRHNVDGAAAAHAYIDAIHEYRPAGPTARANAFHAILIFVPLAAMMARRHGVFERFKAEVIDLLNSDDHLIHLKPAILEMLIDDKRRVGRDDLLRVRDFSLQMPQLISGGTADDITRSAELGCRLADRIGEPHRAWREQRRSVSSDA